MTPRFASGSIATPLPGDMVAEGLPHRLAVKWVAQAPGLDGVENGFWSAVTGHYLMPQERGVVCPTARVRLVYSRIGLHVRLDCRMSSSEMVADGGRDPRLQSDQVSLLFWPSPEEDRSPVVFIEHELSPRGHVQVYCVSNTDGAVERWQPNLDSDHHPRQIILLRQSREIGFSWTADVLLPWELFQGIGTVPPGDHACWRGNIVRSDQVDGQTRYSAWHPLGGRDHHRLSTMGEFIFLPPVQTATFSNLHKTDTIEE